MGNRCSCSAYSCLLSLQKRATVKKSEQAPEVTVVAVVVAPSVVVEVLKNRASIERGPMKLVGAVEEAEVEAETAAAMAAAAEAAAAAAAAVVVAVVVVVMMVVEVVMMVEVAAARAVEGKRNEHHLSLPERAPRWCAWRRQPGTVMVTGYACCPQPLQSTMAMATMAPLSIPPTACQSGPRGDETRVTDSRKNKRLARSGNEGRTSRGHHSCSCRHSSVNGKMAHLALSWWTARPCAQTKPHNAHSATDAGALDRVRKVGLSFCLLLWLPPATAHQTVSSCRH
jgi:hypothetical protein